MCCTSLATSCASSCLWVMLLKTTWHFFVAFSTASGNLPQHLTWLPKGSNLRSVHMLHSHKMSTKSCYVPCRYRTVPYRTVPYRTVPYPQSLQDLAAGEMHLGSDSISHHISREYFCWSRSAAQILRHMGTIAGARTRARAIEVPSPASNYCPDESLQFCRNMHLVTSVVSPLTQQVLACS